jgi:hypothetical protein
MKIASRIKIASAPRACFDCSSFELAGTRLQKFDQAAVLGVTPRSYPLASRRPPTRPRRGLRPRRGFDFQEPRRGPMAWFQPSLQAVLHALRGDGLAEARVALLLASGVTGAQMRALLGVTAATIKTQLNVVLKRPAFIRRPSCRGPSRCFRPRGRRSITDPVNTSIQQSRCLFDHIVGTGQQG